MEILDPKILVAVSGTLFAALVTVTKVLLLTLEKRINEKFALQETHNLIQDKRLDEIERDLSGYKSHVAIGVKETQIMRESINSIAESVSDHIKKEENITWAKIDSIADTVNKIQLDNERAHSAISERLAGVEARVINGYKVTPKKR